MVSSIDLGNQIFLSTKPATQNKPRNPLRLQRSTTGCLHRATPWRFHLKNLLQEKWGDGSFVANLGMGYTAVNLKSFTSW